MVTNKIGEVSYYVDNYLINHWKKNSLAQMKKLNQDKVYIVDGRERIGKSTWAIQQMGVIEPGIFETPEKFVSRIVFSPQDVFTTLRNVRNGVIIIDEAFRALSSRSALSKTNKQMVQAFMEMGQNNNIVFVILPSFFRLDSYISIERGDGLFNIYLDKKNKKRTWRGWNIKAKSRLYNLGVRKGYDYPINTPFKGRFYNKFPGGEKYLNAYLKKKRKSLSSMDDDIHPKKK